MFEDIFILNMLRRMKDSLLWETSVEAFLPNSVLKYSSLD